MNDAVPAPRLDHAIVVRIIVSVMLAALLAVLDHTILSTALPTIARELGDAGSVSWIVLGYMLTSTIAAPIWGKLSDIHGRRRVLGIALIGFMAGSVLCALAPTMLFLILARGVQGVFGGALVSLAQTVIGDVVPPAQRGRYQGYIAGGFAAVGSAGPALGGLLIEHFHWSSVFWINIPFGLVALVATDRLLRRLPQNGTPHSIDVIGAALMALAAAALLLVLSWGGHLYGWYDWRILSLAAASLLLWGLFVLRAAHATEPFVPLSLFRDPTVARIFAGTVLANGANLGIAVFLPLYYQLVLGLSAVQAGLALIVMSVTAMTGSWLSGRHMSRSPHYKRFAVVGLSIAGLAAMTLGFLPAPSLATLIVICAIMSAGFGTYYPVSTISVQNAVPARQLGMVTGTLNFVRSLGGALVVAVFGAIVLGVASPLMQQLPLSGAAEELVRGDLAAAFRTVFFVTAGCVFVAAFLLFRMRAVPLRIS